MQARRRTLLLLLSFFLLAILAGALWLASPSLLRALGNYLLKTNPLPAKADIIFVLAGDPSGLRILTAAELVRQGYAPLVLFSGTGKYYGQREAEIAIHYAIRKGYPASYFKAFAPSARSTEEETALAVYELRRRGIRSVLVVTSNYHTRRTGRIFRRFAPDLEVHIVAAPDLAFHPDAWWRTREGQKVFFIEWSKTVANWLGV